MKPIIRTIAVVMCIILAALTLTSCIFNKVKKEEVPAKATYEFTEIANFVVENNEQMAKETDMLIDIYTRDHLVYYSDPNFNIYKAAETVVCKDGEITLKRYYGEGSTSYMNGVAIYPKHVEQKLDFGTYSGKEVTISSSFDSTLNYKEAYVSEGKFIIHVEEKDQGTVYKYDLVFTEVVE